MARIVYLLFSNGGGTGGQKMTLRHVETLNELGFDAVCYVGGGGKVPSWFRHNAPTEREAPRDDDTVVVPADAPESLETMVGNGVRNVVFAQGGHLPGLPGGEIILRHPERFRNFMAVSPGLTGLLRRLLPQATVETVRCFADDRQFRPAAEQVRRVLLLPWKRPYEAQVIRGFARRLFPHQADYRWLVGSDLTERALAKAMAESAIYLSLPRMESVGITTLEAMASGCVCAGFTGVGGRSYATAENGFWVPDDDCLAAAEAVAEAIELHRSGGPKLRNMLSAAQDAARAWSYAMFRQELETFWVRLAPDARRSRSGSTAHGA